MKESEMKELLIKIGKETLRFGEIITILEVSQNSIKRERYCKKHGISYDQFMQLYRNSKSSIVEYPVCINIMEAVINSHKGVKKEYTALLNEVMKTLNEDYEKSKMTKADEMEKLLTDLKKP